MLEAMILVVLILVVLCVGMTGIWAYNKPGNITVRPDNRIPARERELLGDDWTEKVKGYTHG